MQNTASFAGFEGTRSESDGARARSADDAPYAQNSWRKFSFFWCTPAQCKALRVKALALSVVKIAVCYSMLLGALRFVDFFIEQAVPHSGWCRQLSAAVACVGGVCFDAPLAALFSATVVLAACPTSWLLFPKRKISGETVSATLKEPPNVVAECLPEPVLPEGIKPVAFRPAPVEEFHGGDVSQSSQFPTRTEAAGNPADRRKHESATGRMQANCAEPLIEVSTEPQPCVEPVFAGELEMDALPLPRARPNCGVEEIETARRSLSSSVQEDPGAVLKVAAGHAMQPAKPGRKRKAKTLEVGLAVCVLCPREAPQEVRQRSCG